MSVKGYAGIKEAAAAVWRTQLAESLECVPVAAGSGP